MNKSNAKEELLRNAIRGGLSEEDALLWMVLLHTHEIHLQPGTLEDLNGENVVVLSPDTQRGAAAVIAALWRKRSDLSGRITATGITNTECGPPTSFSRTLRRCARNV
jgi:hypothetical protein